MKNLMRSTIRDGVIVEIFNADMIMRARLIARIIDRIHGRALLLLGIGSPHALRSRPFLKWYRPAARKLGHFIASADQALTRSVKIIIAEDRVQEFEDKTRGRRRPLRPTKGAAEFLHKATPA